jgi:hypothetical protein
LVKLFVRVRLVAIGCRVKPVENVPKKIGRALNRRGKAFRDWRGVYPETPFAVVAAFAPCDKRGRRLAGENFGDFAEKLPDGSAEKRARRRLAGGLLFSARVPVFAARLEDGGGPPGV